MDRIWDTAYLGDTRTLDVHIRWLREKIETRPHAPQSAHDPPRRGLRPEHSRLI